MDAVACHESVGPLPKAGNGAPACATPALLAAALEVAATPVLVMGMDRRISWANLAMLALTGYDFGELVGHPIDLLIPSGESAALYGELIAKVRGGGVWSGRAIARLKDGWLHQHEMTVTPVRTGGEVTHAIVVSHDSAERRQSQARLLLTDRMVSVGTLAASVAHEIDNPLAFLLTNLDFAADKLAAVERGDATIPFEPRLTPQGGPGKEGGPPQSTAAPPAVRSGPARLRARVLVVDDEPLIGATLARVLSAHEVIAVHSAREALVRIGAGERFDAILCDLMMPDMSGMDLHASLAGSAPETAGRMVFLTGGIFTPAARAFADSIPNPMVEKPFDAGALRALVARLVASAT